MIDRVGSTPFITNVWVVETDLQGCLDQLNFYPTQIMGVRFRDGAVPPLCNQKIGSQTTREVEDTVLPHRWTQGCTISVPMGETATQWSAPEDPSPKGSLLPHHNTTPLLPQVLSITAWSPRPCLGTLLFPGPCYHSGLVKTSVPLVMSSPSWSCLMS